MTFDDDIVAAYVDGELEAAAQARVEAAAAAAPQLARRIAAQRALRSLLARAYAPVLAQEPPQALVAAAASPPRGGAEAIPLVRRTSRALAGGARRWRAPQWAAMAACLVAGVLAGRVLVPAGPSVGAAPDRALAASGALARALDRQTAASTGGPIRVGLTFRSKTGHYCRTFQAAGRTTGGGDAAGLACRDSAGWSVRVVAPAAGRDATAYRMAGAQTPTAVLDAVDALIDGGPLDAEGEAKAMANNWRP